MFRFSPIFLKRFNKLTLNWYTESLNQKHRLTEILTEKIRSRSEDITHFNVIIINCWSTNYML